MDSDRDDESGPSEEPEEDTDPLLELFSKIQESQPKKSPTRKGPPGPPPPRKPSPSTSPSSAESAGVPRPPDLPPAESAGVPRPPGLHPIADVLRNIPKPSGLKLTTDRDDLTNRLVEFVEVTKGLRNPILISSLAWLVLAYSSAGSGELMTLSLIFILIGSVQCFFGLIVIELIVALVWIMLGYSLASDFGFGQPENFHLGIFLFFLFTAGFIMTIAPLIAGFVLGFTLGAPILVFLDLPVDITTLLITGIIGAILTLFAFRLSIILATAVNGADILTMGLFLPFEGYSLYISGPSSLYYVVFLLVAICGVYVQFKWTAPGFADG